jgi:hypothetical protein
VGAEILLLRPSLANLFRDKQRFIRSDHMSIADTPETDIREPGFFERSIAQTDPEI